MKKQVYSTPKTRLVTMSENVAIMAGSGGIKVDGGDTGITGGGPGGTITGGTEPPRVHGYSGRFVDFN